MSRDSVLARGRAAAEAGFSDACTSRRKDPTGTTYDDATGNTTPAWTAIYSGPCKLKELKVIARPGNAGESAVLLAHPEVHLPVSAPLHHVGDEITLTASRNDPLSVGRVFIVRVVQGATARRYLVTERTS
jgi:hypothetical protein